MAPTASACETTPICQPDSCQETASASCGSTSWRRAAPATTRRTFSRSGSGCCHIVVCRGPSPAPPCRRRGPRPGSRSAARPAARRCARGGCARRSRPSRRGSAPPGRRRCRPAGRRTTSGCGRRGAAGGRRGRGRSPASRRRRRRGPTARGRRGADRQVGGLRLGARHTPRPVRCARGSWPRGGSARTSTRRYAPTPDDARRRPGRACRATGRRLEGWRGGGLSRRRCRCSARAAAP